MLVISLVVVLLGVFYDGYCGFGLFCVVGGGYMCLRVVLWMV